MEYTVLESTDVEELVSMVNESIKMGWALQGGIAVYESTVDRASERRFYPWYYQAMVKPSKDEQ